METFSKDLVSRNRHSLISNRYDEQVQTTKNKVVTMENLSLTEYSTTKEALQFYSRGAVLATVGLLTSALTYPLSVRIAKRIFRLKDFLNVHLAALPFILNANAFVLGVAQGFINDSFLERRYPQEGREVGEL